MAFFTIIMMGMLAGIEVDIFVPSFPELAKVFDLSPFLLQLSLSVNFGAYCVSSLIVGALADKYGRRSILLLGLIVFIFGSVLCTIPLTFEMLLFGRFLQGVGIAGPNVLSMALIVDEYPPEKQSHMLGIFNGVITLAMAFAPVFGSYINLYFGWQGNFLVLLLLGVVCFALCWKFLPFKGATSCPSLSMRDYLPLLKSKHLMAFALAICCFIIPYYVFVGMAPILYMKEWGVSLAHFGFYQGFLAVVFGLTSLTSPLFLKAFGERVCFYGGWGLVLLSVFGVLYLGLIDARDPLLITGVYAVASLGGVFPVNTLYPTALRLYKEDRGKAAALLVGLRLLGTAFCLQVVSYFYNKNFWSTSLTIFIGIMISSVVVVALLKWQWLTLRAKEKRASS